jgi:hypothetical protein
MKYWTPFVLLMLSAIALRGQIDQPAGVLTIYTRFASPASALSIGEMRAELDAIMLPFHMRFDWRSLDNASGHEVVAEVVVVSFKGACRVDSVPLWGPPAGTLGWTHIADGEILPFADVDCDKIRELITTPLAVSHPMEREGLLGRAMARVLAHELYHFLAHTTKHASTGIAKASYSGAELASNSLRFDPAQLHMVLGGTDLALQTACGGPRGSAVARIACRVIR